MEEMYIKTVALIGIANNYQKEIDNLNRRLFSSIVNMYKSTSTKRIHNIIDNNAIIINTKTYAILDVLIDSVEQKIRLQGISGYLSLNIKDLPIEAKYQLVKLLDLENG